MARDARKTVWAVGILASGLDAGESILGALVRVLRMTNASEWTLSELKRFDSADYDPTEYGPPTGHPAGSVEKVEVLRQRFEAGLILHHPQDAKIILIQERRTRSA